MQNQADIISKRGLKIKNGAIYQEDDDRIELEQ